MRVLHGRKSGEQLVAALIIYLGAAIVLLSLPGAIGGGLNTNSNNSNSNNNNNASRTLAKFQARILLESNNLDIEHEKSGSVNLASSLGGADSHQISKNETIVATATNNTTTTTTRAPTRRKGKKKERSSRRLSNIWSMFMPGGSSNNDQDYEENLDESEEVPVTGENNVAAAQLATTTLAPMGVEVSVATATNSERHDEKLVAKYSRPPRQEGLELLGVNQALPGIGQTQNQTGTTGSTTPASLATGPMTGSLSGSSNEAPGSTPVVAQPNMNDIVSNIMSSMSLPSNTSEPTSVDNVEREEESGNKNRTGGDQFEQWLNRIQFRQNSAAGGGSSSSSSSSNNRPQVMSTANATRWSMPRQQQPSQHNASSAHRLQPSDVMRAMEILAAERARSQLYHHQQQGQAHKQHHHNQLIIARATKTAGAEPQHSKIRSPSKINQELASRQQQQQRYKAPVQFMHLRQKSSVLPVYHANRYSQAQASTLSVNLMDANNSSSQQSTTSSTTESTNSTASTSSPKLLNDEPGLNEQPQQQQQSVEQLNSQDEILKQVTSAIDFEQKLNQKKHYDQVQQEPHNADELSTIEGLSKMFKVGNNLNELAGGVEGNGTSGTPKPNGQNQQVSPMELLKASLGSRNSGNSSSLNNVVGVDGIDNNFDLIAEKLRHLAQQQQQVSNQTRQQQPAQQPTWLRPPVVGLGSAELVDGNLTRLASLLSQHQPPGVVGNLLVNQSSQATIDRLRELLDKHERHKNELKSSQESMELLMKQLTEMQNNNGNGNNKVSAQQVRLRAPGSQQRQKGPMKTQQQQLQLQQVIEGWRPLMAPPMSPAKLIKGQPHHQQLHFNKHPLRISQLQDNIGTGNDYISDDLSELGLVFSQMRAGQRDATPGNEIHQALNEGQRILGLPLAILKEDEHEGTGELELAHQQHHDHQRKAHLFAQRLSDSNNNAGAPAPPVVPSQLLAALNNQQHQHQQGEQVDYLINPNRGEQTDQLDSTATGELPGPAKGVAKEQPRKPEMPPPPPPLPHHPASLQQQHHHHHHQHQDLQRAQQLHRDVSAPHQHQLLQMQQQQQRQVSVSGGGSGVYGQVRPPVMATALAQQGSGLPVRFREISVFRPFGYESHHAIAYQASPAVAALFPGLTQSTRPSILRHMTPFRAIQTQRGLLNPMSQVQLADTMRAASAPSPAAYPLDGASYHARQAMAPAAGLPMPGDDPLGPTRSRYLRLTNLNHQ